MRKSERVGIGRRRFLRAVGCGVAVAACRGAVMAAGRPARAHVYLDTGMSRMGVPYHRALPWLLEVTRLENVQIEGTFTGFTEDPEFDVEQLRRFTELAAEARSRGANLGLLHAASSAGVFNFREAHLDLVRPGISLFGAYPSNEGTEREIAQLRPAFRLRARVVRVQRLRPGDNDLELASAAAVDLEILRINLGLWFEDPQLHGD